MKEKAKIHRLTVYLNRLQGIEFHRTMLILLGSSAVTKSYDGILSDLSVSGYQIKYKSDQDRQMAHRLNQVINEQIENLY